MLYSRLFEKKKLECFLTMLKVSNGMLFDYQINCLNLNIIEEFINNCYFVLTEV